MEKGPVQPGKPRADEQRKSRKALAVIGSETAPLIFTNGVLNSA